MILGITALAALFLVLAIAFWAIAANQTTPLTLNGIGWIMLLVFFIVWGVENFGGALTQ